MIALVGNIVWACIAGIGIALVLALSVAVLVRLQRPAAATRCALWFLALATCAIAPPAIVGAMIARGVPATTIAPDVASPFSSSISPAASSPRSSEATSGHRAGSDGTGDVDGALSQPRSASALAAIADVSRTLRRPPSLTGTVALTIVAVWAAGALLGLFGLGRGLLRVRALKARSSPLEGALADELPWLTETAGREIYLRLSYEIETPIAVGFRRPVILLPTDMATADGLRAIEPLIMHEYAHLARHDDWWNLVQRTIERIFWFNPLVWYAGRRIALEREVAADDVVVARTHDAKQYASTLWRMAREMRMPEHVVVAPGAMLTRKQISIRIERLLEDSRGRRPQFGTGLAVLTIGACTVAAVAATAPPIVLPAAPARTIARAVATPQAAPTEEPSTAPEPEDASVTSPAVPASPALAASPAAPATPVAPVRSVTPKVSKVSTVPNPPAVPGVPSVRWLPQDMQREIDAATKAAADVQREVTADALRATHDAIHGAMLPHALPKGELTRAIVASCRTCDFSRRDLSGLDLSNLSFLGANFSGADLSGTNFSGARFTGVSFDNAHMSGANLSHVKAVGSEFAGADLDSADLSNARFIGSTLDLHALRGGNVRSVLDGCDGCNFANADLHGQDLHGIRLDGGNLENANLAGANLRGARLVGTNFQNANLDRADLRDANLTGANLSDASMAHTLLTNATLTGTALP